MMNLIIGFIIGIVFTVLVILYAAKEAIKEIEEEKNKIKY